MALETLNRFLGIKLSRVDSEDFFGGSWAMSPKK